MKYRCVALIILLLLASGCTRGEDESDVCEVTGPSETLFPPVTTPPEPKFSQEEVGNKSLTYLVENFLKQQGFEGELVGNEEYGEDLYLLRIHITRGGQTENLTVFATRDGKLILIGQGGGIVDIFEEPVPTPTTAPPARVVPSVDDDPFIGPEDAPVVIIEFSDFQCSYCKTFHDEFLPLILDKYGDSVKFVYRDLPLGFHQFAQKASEASECADEQGKYWEYHHKIYENQNALDTASLKSYAAELGLDTEQFDECLDSGKYAEEVAKDVADAKLAGISSTPNFFVNDQLIKGLPRSFSVFEQAIEAELAKQ